MAFMSVLFMIIIFMIVFVVACIAACLVLGGVFLCWILTIAFTITKKRTARKITFVIATLSTLLCIGIAGGLYYMVQYEKIQTDDGKEVSVNVDLTDEFLEKIRKDDVDGVRSCLEEEPALMNYIFFGDNTGPYAKAMEYDAVQVMTYFLENGQAVDDFFPDEEESSSLVHSAIHFYFHYKNEWDEIAEMKGNRSKVFEPQIVRILLAYHSDMTYEGDCSKPLLQDVLMCCCADGDFSEDEYQLLQELIAGGMPMDSKFEIWEEEEEEEEELENASVFFARMARRVGILENQPDMYEKVQQLLA